MVKTKKEDALEENELLIEKREGICTIKFNRPEQLNAVYPQLLDEFVSALMSADSDKETKVVIITGVGRAFCAGVDIKQVAKGIEEGKPLLSSFEEMVPTQVSAPWIAWVIRNMKKPVIAAINGAAIGAGFSIALACDIRIASEKAQIGALFVNVGLIPELGSTYSLPRLVGIAKACELVFTGKTITAQEAKEIGLVNCVVAANNLEAFAYEMARSIMQWPALSIQIAKRALYQGLDSTLASQLQFEALGLGICSKTEDHAEAISSFLEKRKPIFKGR